MINEIFKLSGEKANKYWRRIKKDEENKLRLTVNAIKEDKLLTKSLLEFLSEKRNLMT